MDTLAGTADGSSRGEVAKMIPFVHHNAIVASRGHLTFSMMAFIKLFFESVLADFDAMLDKAPELLERGFQEALALAPQFGISLEGEYPADAQTHVLVGWSQRAQVPLARVFDRRHGEAAFKHWYLWPACRGAEEGHESYCAPWNPEDRSLEPHASLVPYRMTTDSTAQMLELARAQKRLAHQVAPGAVTGGRFIIAEISARGMSIASAGELPEA